MSREKKSQVDDLTKLRKILDNSSNPDIVVFISKNENALDSVRRRLAGERVTTQSHVDNFLRKYNSLEPRVTVHAKSTVSPRMMTSFPTYQPSTTLPEFKFVSSSVPTILTPSQEISLTPEELFEVEKVDVITPEFIEVTPKELQKSLETGMTLTNEDAQEDDAELPEWQPIQEIESTEPAIHQETPGIDANPEFERTDISATPEKVKTIDGEPLPAEEISIETPVEFLPIKPQELQPLRSSKKQDREAKKAQKKKEKEAKRLKKLELKKLKIEKREKERETTRIIEKQPSIQQTPDEEPPRIELIQSVETTLIKVDLNAYEDIKSIDEQTAELLYKNGYFSLDNLRDASIDDLVQIRGIKRKLAKQIKKEIEQKIKTTDDLEFVPAKHITSKKKTKIALEDTTEWESSPSTTSGKKRSSISPCTYKGYTLYKRKTDTHRGKKTTTHFFSKEKPDNGQPAQLPDEYQIAVNKKTGIPYLRKKR